MLKVPFAKLASTIKTNTISYALCLLIPILAFIGYTYITHIKTLLLTDARNSLIAISTHTSKSIDQSLDNNLLQLKHFNLNPQLHEDLSLEEKIKLIIADPHYQTFSRIAIADLAGNALSSDGVAFSIADRDYFQQAKQGSTVVSEPLDSRIDDGQKIIVQALPLRNNDQVTGVLLASEHPENITNAIANMYYLGQLRFLITRDNGQIISQSATVPMITATNILELFHAPEYSEILQQLKHGLASRTPLTLNYRQDDRGYILSYMPIPNFVYDWHLFVILPNSVALALTNEVLQLTAVLVFIVIALLSIIFIYILKNKKEYIEALKISDYRYKIISEQTENIIFDWDLTKNTTYFSTAWNNKFTCSPPLNILTDDFSSLYSADIPLLKTAIAKLVTGEQIAAFDVRVKTAHQKFVCVNIHPTLIFNEEKKPIRIIGVITDVTARRLKEIEIKQKTEYDALSKLLNRITFEERARQTLETAASNQQPLAFLFVDIDDFRLFNNEYGHAFGDRVITFIGSCLNNFAHNIGFAGRNGGDEFIVCVTDPNSINNIEYITNRLQAFLKDGLHARESDPKISVGSSIGIVKFPESGKTYDELIKKADEGMYKAKAAGKGRYYLL